MSSWIACEEVVFVTPEGDRRPGRIAIAAPVGGDGEATCVIALDGLEPPLTARGVSTLQALLSGTRQLGLHLQAFLGRGGRVLFPSAGDDGRDEDVPLSALFGVLLRDADRHSPYWLERIAGPQG